MIRWIERGARTPTRAFAGLFCAVILGCGGTDGDRVGPRASREPNAALAPADASAESAPPTTTSPTRDLGAPPAPDAGTPLTSDGGPAHTTLTGLPAAVCGILRDHGCVTCHQRPLTGGAPMPLQVLGDLQRKAADGSPLMAKLLARVQDARAPMPPASSGRPLLPAARVELLRAWSAAGMPGAATDACLDVPSTPDAGTAAPTPVWPEQECEYTFTIGAHGADGTPRASDSSPYLPPALETSYHCFYEKVPWGDKQVQALALRARLEGTDDPAMVHHLVLSALSPSSSTSLGGARPTRGGAHHDCPNQSGATVSVWGPGRSTLETLPADVGMQMPSGSEAYLELQVHYNNAKQGAKSRVAFDVCATTKPRPHTAGVHWLGFENAALALPLGELGPTLDNKGNGVGQGTCKAKQRARILSLMPHMHLRGRYATVEILRKSGAVETVHAGPFNASEQAAYPQRDLWIEQGESIRTTCKWDPTLGKILFGQATKDEMCFVYALAYPVGALAGMGAELGIVGGELNCAGAP